MVEGVVTFVEAVGFARTHLRADAGRLWGADLAEVEWRGIAGDRLRLPADPQVAGYEPAETGLWTGPLPDGLGIANTAVRWAGRTWASITLPIHGGQDAAARLLVHEG